MLADRYDLPLSTASAVARDAYAQASERLLTHYPGAIEAFDRAIAADPGFALAHVGKAQVLMRDGKMAAAQASMAEARSLAAGLSEREASHLAFFGLILAGQAGAALSALRVHLRTWPRDAMMLSTAANPNGLIGASGRIGQKREIASLMDGLASDYGDDWWFLAHHAMALSEDGRRGPAHAKDGAHAKIERSLAGNPNNANAAHARAHICYEDGDPDAARAFLTAWLAAYPRDGFFHGHLSWHLALGELEAGNAAAASRLYHEAFAPDRHSGSPQLTMMDAAGFLWRWELAGHPRDPAGWAATHAYANGALPRSGNGLADMHVLLAQAVVGDGAGLEGRVREMEEMARMGRYPSGPYLPALSRAFAAFERRDFATAIDTLEPLAREDERERIGGSRAQLDLVEFTLSRAYLHAGRADAARRLAEARRPGPSGIPVAGLAAVR